MKKFKKEDFIIRGTMLVGLNKSGLEKIGKATILEIPEGITVISDYAFNNIGLEKVIFPNSVRKVGADAFRSNKLKEVIFNGDKLEIISAYAFYDNKIELLKIENTKNVVISGFSFAKNKINKETKDKLTIECAYVDASSFISK